MTNYASNTLRWPALASIAQCSIYNERTLRAHGLIDTQCDHAAYVGVPLNNQFAMPDPKVRQYADSGFIVRADGLMHEGQMVGMLQWDAAVEQKAQAAAHMRFGLLLAEGAWDGDQFNLVTFRLEPCAMCVIASDAVMLSPAQFSMAQSPVSTKRAPGRVLLQAGFWYDLGGDNAVVAPTSSGMFASFLEWPANTRGVQHDTTMEFNSPAREALDTLMYTPWYEEGADV